LNAEHKNIGYYRAVILFIFLFFILSLLRCFNLHSTFFDLGIYEGIIYRVAFHKEWYLLFAGHVTPILFVHSLIYRIFPSTETLLILQILTVALGSYPLYLIAKKKLKGSLPLAVVISYFAYYGVEYNVLFDFHPDHIIIPILFYAFYYLEENKLPQFIFACIIGLSVKEPFNLVIMMLGVYSIIKYKNIKSGVLVAILGFLMFTVDFKLIIPYFNSVGSSIQSTQLSKFGVTVPEMIVNIFVKPQVLLSTIFSESVTPFIGFVFVPLLFIPFLAPLALIVALPMFLMLFSTGSPLHIGIANHYLASIIPPIFIAFVYGLKILEKYKHLLLIVLVITLLTNIVLSPSLVSYTFWKGKSMSFSYKVYLPEKRDNMIKENIKKYIPANPNVRIVSQNSLNYEFLTKRLHYRAYPDQFEIADYIVLDLKRHLFMLDKVNEKEFIKIFEIVKKTQELVYENDGFYIFRKPNKK